MTVSQRTVKTCSGAPAGAAYAVGDTVVVKDALPTLGRVRSITPTGYQVEWAEGITNDVQGVTVLAQVCR
jgi:hypothetical protein